MHTPTRFPPQPRAAFPGRKTQSRGCLRNGFSTGSVFHRHEETFQVGGLIESVSGSNKVPARGYRGYIPLSPNRLTFTSPSTRPSSTAEVGNLSSACRFRTGHDPSVQVRGLNIHWDHRPLSREPYTEDPPSDVVKNFETRTPVPGRFDVLQARCGWVARPFSGALSSFQLFGLNLLVPSWKPEIRYCRLFRSRTVAPVFASSKYVAPVQRSPLHDPHFHQFSPSAQVTLWLNHPSFQSH
ncbi:hypothetical protein LX32DRAFT_260209 [Colletotrichum zoysiae]|uniref:Uncharacterized protein n=1 Tax=Colletotrichum zoysiae TaxID=1216348 RepID=A0AAD9LUW1_9PEZI|nr:hypothetical protein LX32DRAFT_260209 [Colletotrichum zoysiae]